MSSHLNESDLNSWIEGILEPSQARSIDARLAAQPALQDRVRQMRHDRDVLRSLDLPSLDVDLVRAIEPQLARAILVEDPPAPFVLHQRSRRFGGPAMLASAAMLMLSTAVFTWLVAGGPTPWSDKTPTEVAFGPTDGASGPSPVVPAVDSPSPALALAKPNADEIIYHDAPLVVALPGSVDAAPNLSPALAAADALPKAALVVRAKSLDGAIASLQAILAPVNDRSALVENLSFSAAAEYERRWIAGHTGGSDSRKPLLAGIDRENELPLTPLQRGEVIRRVQEVEPSALGRQLSGRKELAPTPEMQLALSEARCTHALVLPRDRVAEILAQLDRGNDVLASISALGEFGSATKESPSTDSWNQWSTWLAADVWTNRPDGTVVIPLRIEEHPHLRPRNTR